MIQPTFRIPAPDFLRDPALQAVMAALPEARIVGGAVRDALAGQAVADVDLATPRLPEDVIAALRTAGLKSAPTGIGHGTVTAISAGRGFEVTTLRRDVATDGRRATVAFSTDWREDAERRDFTINAMSMDRDGGVYDWFGGAEDLRAGRVRFVGQASVRIAEDYLRILRFFRFHARYAHGTPDAEAMTAIRGGLAGLRHLSAERVWSEVKRILAAPDPRAAVRLMRETGVLDAILPEAGPLACFERLVVLGAPVCALLRLAALLRAGTDIEALAARWRMSRAEAGRLAGMCRGEIPQIDPRTIRQALYAQSDGGRHDPRPDLGARTWLAQARGEDGDWDALRAAIAVAQVPVFPLEGRDVLALGGQPGPEVGRVLAQVEAQWRDGNFVASAEELRADLVRFLRN